MTDWEVKAAAFFPHYRATEDYCIVKHAHLLSTFDFGCANFTWAVLWWAASVTLTSGGHWMNGFGISVEKERERKKKTNKQKKKL